MTFTINLYKAIFERGPAKGMSDMGLYSEKNIMNKSVKNSQIIKSTDEKTM